MATIGNSLGISMPTFQTQSLPSFTSYSGSSSGGLGAAGWASLGGSITNAVGGLLSSGLGLLGGHLQRKWENEQREKQNEWNLAQWNRENEYNSPIQQMQRLKDAGINPIDTSQLTDAGTSGTGLRSAGVNPVNVPHFNNPFSGIGDWGDAFVKQAAADKLKADADLARTQADVENELKDGKIKLFGYELDLAANNVQLTAAEKERIAKETSRLDATINLLKAQTDAESRRISLEESKFLFDKTMQEAKYQLEKFYKENQLSLEERRLFVDMMNAEANQVMANVAGSAEYRQLQKHEIEMLILDNEGKISTEKVSVAEFEKRIAAARAEIAEKQANWVRADKFKEHFTSYVDCGCKVATTVLRFTPFGIFAPREDKSVSSSSYNGIPPQTGTGIEGFPASSVNPLYGPMN
ncbi:minor capsid protein [Capybara microvirus Cap1_SP_70]|nr:minor capsid protein [Capybara microvirus Cap1_SP_70]